MCFGWSGMWLSPASPSHPKKYTGNSFNFGKVPNPYFEKFQVNLVGCSAAVVGTSQHPEKSIPAIVLILERSVGGFEKFKCVLVGLGYGCHRHLPATQKKYTGNSFNFGKVPNPYFEKFQVNLVGCSAAVVGTSQHPEKSIPAIVLKSERSLTHILRNFK